MSIKAKRVAYRTIVSVIALLASLAALDCYVGYTISRNYFPHQSHTANLIWMFAYLFVGLILCSEAIFLIVFRRFTPTI